MTSLAGFAPQKLYNRVAIKISEDVMDQGSGLFGTRRNEDIALDMMKFIAITTQYGKVGAPGAGFQGGTVSKPEDYASHLLDLYTLCLNTVNGRK
jgi:hypothetical protein